MAPNDRQRADVLDRYWDAALRGDPLPRLEDVDDVTAAVIKLLGEPHMSPQQLEAQQRVRRQIISPTIVSEDTTSTMERRETNDAASGSRAMGWPVDQRGLARPRWGVAPLAAAALLLLTLGFAAVVFEGARPDRTTLIAIDQATPLPGVTEETLVDIRLPAEALPQGVAGSALSHFTLLPGDRTTWRVFQNVNLVYVLRGALIVRPDGPMQVSRSGRTGAWDTVASGDEVKLGPGDAGLMLNRTTIGFDNAGPDQVEFVQWILASGPRSDPPMPSAWVVNAYDLSGAGGVTLPGEPAQLRLRRLVMAANASDRAPPGAVLQFAITPPFNMTGTPVAAAVTVTRLGDRVVNTSFGQEATVYVVTLEPTGAAG